MASQARFGLPRAQDHYMLSHPMLSHPVSLERTRMLPEPEELEVAVEAYTYAYPMLVMDVTRRARCNVEWPDRELGAGAPVNQLSHQRTVADAAMEQVTRPNPDTLSSSLWFDVSREPLIVSVPSAAGRFHSLSLLDHWSEVFASPSTRTTGAEAQTFAIVGPTSWGRLPRGMHAYRAPTALGWLVADTEVEDASDIPNVARFQAGFSVTPLGSWGQLYTPPRGRIDPSVPSGRPVDVVARMPAAEYFSRFCELTRKNPPHPHDYPLLDRMRRIGIVAGRKLDFSALAPSVRKALGKARSLAVPSFREAYEQTGQLVNHWRLSSKPRGVYGTDYSVRAGVAFAALGAPANEEASSALVSRDASGAPLDSALRYTLTFSRYALPPAKAFWSLALYNDRQLLAANSLGRYALGDRDDLLMNDDGSITLHVQRTSPGAKYERNWLPAPRNGCFSMVLRLYWPAPEALTGRWRPPLVQRVE